MGMEEVSIRPAERATLISSLPAAQPHRTEEGWE